MSCSIVSLILDKISPTFNAYLGHSAFGKAALHLFLNPGGTELDLWPLRWRITGALGFGASLH